MKAICLIKNDRARMLGLNDRHVVGIVPTDAPDILVNVHDVNGRYVAAAIHENDIESILRLPVASALLAVAETLVETQAADVADETE
jgi:hypothetical protein